MTVQVLEYGAPTAFDTPFNYPPAPAGGLEFDVQPPPSGAIKPDQVITSDGTIYELRGDKYRETAPIVKPGQQTRDSIKPFRPKPARPPLRGTAPAGNVTTLLNELAGPSGGLSPSNEKIIDDLGDWLTGLGTGLIESLGDLPRSETPLDNELTVHLEKGIGVGHLIGDAINDIQWPEIETPEINWPELELPPIDIQWPEINWPELEWPDIEAPPINLPKPPEINWPWDWPEDDPIVEPSPEDDPEPEHEPPPTPEPPKPEDFPLIPPYGDSFTEEPDISPDDSRTGWCRLRIEVSSTYVEAVYNLNVPSRNRDPYSQSYGPFERWAWIRGPMKKNLGSYKFFQLSHNPTSWTLTNFPYVAGTAYRVINPNRPDDPPLFPDANPNYRPVILGTEPQLIKLETLLVNATSGSLDEYFFGDRRWQKWNSSVTIRWYCDGDGSGSSSPPPPLAEPSDNMSCSCDDLKRMLRSMKGKVQVPVCYCEEITEDDLTFWRPRIEQEQIEIFAVDETTLENHAKLYAELAETKAIECESRNTHRWLKSDRKIIVPKTLITPPDRGWFGGLLDFIIPEEQKEIESLPDLIEWMIENFSAFMGDFGQEIVVPGEVREGANGEVIEIPGKLYIPDIATGISQIILLLLNLQDDEETARSLGVRNLVETHIARQQATMANQAALTVLDALGAHIKKKKITLPATFTMPDDEVSGADDIDTDKELKEFLKEGTTQIVGVEYDDKYDLKDDLKIVMEAAAIIKAKFAQVFPNDISDEALKELLRNSVKRYTAGKRTPEENNADWDAWLEKVETGFTTEGTTDPINPYGRTPDRRPRIREIGETDDS